jgi:Cft2 family RNA processing exonuclease
MPKQSLFYYDRALKLLPVDLAIDAQFRQARAFVSHAHADHIARHEYVLCTEETAALLNHRLGPRVVRTLRYGEAVDWAGVRLTVYPAGHCLGSAMLLVEYAGERLLYTGDFKLRPSLTVPPAQPVAADILIMECTYGHPLYRFPPEEVVFRDLVNTITRLFEQGVIPVIVAYALGKSQEISRRLSDAGLDLVLHRHVAEISRIYESFGVNVGRYRVFDGTVRSDEVLVVAPGTKLNLFNDRIYRIAVTGWAMEPSARFRLGVDVAFPFSDHADYDGLLELIELVRPRVIDATHGPECFVRDLQVRGWEAYLLDRPTQKTLL